ncbi:MAG: sugar O-acetyltransferase, partial [Rhizobiales bacterium]|nr:sugar O-acetyltransferase [Hyphomicrobiales bacterium]
GEGYSSPITIGNGAWLGAACTILGGTTVGEKAVIAAGAVTKGDVSAKTVYKGL